MNTTNPVPSKLKKAGIYIILTLFVLQIFLSSAVVSEATLYKKPTPVQTSEIRSYAGDELPDEYFKVRTPLKTKSTIYVSGKVTKNTKRLCIRLFKHKGSKYYITSFVTPDKNGEFSVKISTKKGSKKAPTILSKKGTAAKAKDSYSTCPGYKAVPSIGTGTYHLTIAKATTTKDAKISGNTKWWKGTLGGSTTKWFAYKEVLLTVKSGHSNDPKVVKYSTAVNNNKAIRSQYDSADSSASGYQGSYERYMDKYMTDMGYIFKDPKTGENSPMTASRVNYITKLAKKVTSGYSSDYKKMQAIYKYVATNFYYDRYAYSQGKYEYANPYLNLYHFNNKSGSGANYKNGNVATTCQGYAAMVIAMARSLDIPARYVYGNHITLTGTIWADKKDSDVSKRSHWWAEAYVDGRWIVIDANAGSYNKWFRSSFSDAGTWSYGGLGNYSAFDPSDEQLSSSYIYNDVYPGSKEGRFASNASEVSQLKAFLETDSSGVKNGTLLNSSYSADDLSTWGDGDDNNFATDGYGRITKIQWSQYGLSGDLDLTGYEKLRYLTVYSNDISSIRLDNCPSLIYISANNNELTSFDSSGISSLETINVWRNPLKSAKLAHDGRTISISVDSPYEDDSFSLKYNGASGRPLTVYSGKTSGKYMGIYDSSGNRVSSRTEYTFSPSDSSYTVRYAEQ